MTRFLIMLLLALFPCFVFSQKKEQPREGEGIQSFLRRHKILNEQDYNAFLELNKGKFGRGNTLLKGVYYTLPASTPTNKAKQHTHLSTTGTPKIGTKLSYPLFGKKYAEYTIKSHRLKGACFYLSSGHGGPDPGAIGEADGHKLHEDEYAYDITLRLARALMEEGATVHMIIQDEKDGIRDSRYLKNSKRETCMGASIPLGQVARLKQRANKINSLSRKSKAAYQRSIFIHLDSRSKSKKLDVFFYYAKNSTAGKKLANTMLKTFDDHYNKHQPNRGFTGTVSTRNLYMLDKTNPVAVFVELGNIRNSFDQRRFLDPNNRQALANWLCRGFIADYESL